ncbi:MAG: hypothetical protein ACP5D7_22520 [Limnospira sp.]
MTRLNCQVSTFLEEEDRIIDSSSTTNDSIRVNPWGITDRSLSFSNPQKADICIASETSADLTIDESKKLAIAKSYWRIHQPIAIRSSSKTFIYQSKIQPLEDTGTTISSTEYFDPDVDDEPEDYRGILAVKHQRKLIFSEEIEIQVKNLPRRKPRITIDRRMVEIEDD